MATRRRTRAQRNGTTSPSSDARPILADWYERIEAGEDPEEVKAIAHELLDPSGD
jgi:hypothetical protein